MAVNRFTGATNSNWGTSTNWSLSAVPTAIDGNVATFDNTSPNCTVDTSVKVCNHIDFTGYTNTITFSFQISVSGNVTLDSGMHFAGAVTNKLRMIAAGTWRSNGMTCVQNVEIGGTTTFTATLFDALTTSGDLLLSNTTSTIFSGAFDITAATATVSGSQTLTLTGNIIVSGLSTIADANIINTSTGKEWRTAGMTVSGALTGTAVIVFNGTGIWTGTAAISNSVTITGTVTMAAGNNLFAASGTPTLTATAGTIAGTGVLSIASSCTIAGGTWPSVLLTAALTLTTTNSPTFTTMTGPNAAVTFAGASGFTAGTFANTAIASTAKTYTFTQGNTYTVTDGMDLTGATAALTLTLISSHASNKVVFTVRAGAVQDVAFVVATRLDSSAGMLIFDYKGTLTTTFNWSTTAQPMTFAAIGSDIIRGVAAEA